MDKPPISRREKILRSLLAALIVVFSFWLLLYVLTAMGGEK